MQDPASASRIELRWRWDIRPRATSHFATSTDVERFAASDLVIDSCELQVLVGKLCMELRNALHTLGPLEEQEFSFSLRHRKNPRTWTGSGFTGARVFPSSKPKSASQQTTPRAFTGEHMLHLYLALATIHRRPVNRDEVLEEGTRRRVYWTMQLLGVGQTELEEKAGIGSGTLANFFDGRRGGAGGTTRKWLLKIADALDVDYGWLSTGRKPDPARAHMDLDLKPIPPRRRGRPPAGERNAPWVAKNTALAKKWEAPRKR